MNLLATRCSSYRSLKLGKCLNKSIPMGIYTPKYARGNYYLGTNKKSPYGKRPIKELPMPILYSNDNNNKFWCVHDRYVCTLDSSISVLPVSPRIRRKTKPAKEITMAKLQNKLSELGAEAKKNKRNEMCDKLMVESVELRNKNKELEGSNNSTW